MGQNQNKPVAFTLTPEDHQIYIFENPSHDFPKKDHLPAHQARLHPCQYRWRKAAHGPGKQHFYYNRIKYYGAVARFSYNKNPPFDTGIHSFILPADHFLFFTGNAYVQEILSIIFAYCSITCVLSSIILTTWRTGTAFTRYGVGHCAGKVYNLAFSSQLPVIYIILVPKLSIQVFTKPFNVLSTCQCTDPIERHAGKLL